MSGRIHSVNIIILKLVLIFMVSIPLQVSSKQQIYDHFLYEGLENITIRVPVNEVSIKSNHLLCEKKGEIIIVDSIIESFSSHDKELICVFSPMDCSPYLISAKYYLDIETTSGNHIFSDSVVVNVKMPDTGLPVMSVKLDEEVSNIQRETYLTAFLTMAHGVDTLFVDEKLKIKGRGNGTWKYPKKPYKLKFDKKVPLLGEGKHYALLSSYTDKTFLRHALSMDMSFALNLDWTPSYEYVELIINNQYLGTYILSETVRRDKNRLQLMDDGYLIEDDAYYSDEPLYFQTWYFSRFYTFKYPEPSDVTASLLEDIKNTIDKVERYITYCEENDSIFEYIDLTSFAKWYYLNNILKNLDPNLFYYKESASQKLKMGPYWDTEWTFGNGWYYGDRPNPEHWIVSRTPYFDKLPNNGLFFSTLQKIHSEYRNVLIDTFNNIFEKYKEQLRTSQMLNYKRWPNLNELVDIGLKPLGSWELECDDLKFYFLDHVNYIDNWLNISSTNINVNKQNEQIGKVAPFYNLMGIKTNCALNGVYIIGCKKIYSRHERYSTK